MIFQLIFLGLVVGSNNLAASLALGALGQISKRWRAIVIFGLFEFLMPLSGMWLGVKTSEQIAEWANTASVIILLLLAALSFYAAFNNKNDNKKLARDITSWKGLFLLGLGLSMDNLAVGFSLGLGELEQSPVIIALTIGIFSMFYTWGGMHIGDKAKKNWEKQAKIMAGILLVFLAIATWLELI
jgi:manganese efflux pump family protein